MLSGLTVLMLVTNELAVIVAILAIMRGGRLERVFGLLLLLNELFRAGLRRVATDGDDLGWLPFVLFAGAVVSVMAWTAVRHRSLWAGAVFVTYATQSGIAVATLAGPPRAHVGAEALLRMAGALCLGGAALRAWLGPPRKPPSGRDVDLLAAAR